MSAVPIIIITSPRDTSRGWVCEDPHEPTSQLRLTDSRASLADPQAPDTDDVSTESRRGTPPDSATHRVDDVTPNAGAPDFGPPLATTARRIRSGSKTGVDRGRSRTKTSGVRFSQTTKDNQNRSATTSCAEQGFGRVVQPSARKPPGHAFTWVPYATTVVTDGVQPSAPEEDEPPKRPNTPEVVGLRRSRIDYEPMFGSRDTLNDAALYEYYDDLLTGGPGPPSRLSRPAVAASSPRRPTGSYVADWSTRRRTEAQRSSMSTSARKGTSTVTAPPGGRSLVLIPVRRQSTERIDLIDLTIRSQSDLGFKAATPTTGSCSGRSSQTARSSRSAAALRPGQPKGVRFMGRFIGVGGRLRPSGELLPTIYATRCPFISVNRPLSLTERV